MTAYVPTANYRARSPMRQPAPLQAWHFAMTHLFSDLVEAYRWHARPPLAHRRGTCATHYGGVGKILPGARPIVTAAMYYDARILIRCTEQFVGCLVRRAKAHLLTISETPPHSLDLL